MRPEDRTTETERRHATVLFGDLTGFTSLSEHLDPEQLYAIVNRCLDVLTGIVRKHGGLVERYLGDCVMAVFGAPVATEEATRGAVNAAIEMRNAVAAFNEEQHLERPLAIHSGINTGLMISADVANSPVQREFSVMGDTVNVASRLKDLAPPGAIYVGPETFRNTRDDFEYRELKPVQLKGKQEAVVPYELLSEHEQVFRSGAERRGSRSPFVGREGELSRLVDAAEAAGAGVGSVVSIVGEAGVGKSRLVSELLAQSALGGIQAFQGRSLYVGRTLSFHPFRDLVRHWAEIGEDRTPLEAAQRLDEAVTATLGRDAADALPFLRRVLRLPMEAAAQERLDQLEGDALERLVFRSVRELLGSIAAVPTVLVFEDVFWADLSSVNLLEGLLPLVERRPILVVLVSRPGFADTTGRLLAAAERLSNGRHTRIDLGPLRSFEAHRMIDNFFRDGHLPSDTRALIGRMSGGNPFFIEQTVRRLLDEGAVERRHGRLVATDRIGQVEISGSVRETVMARLDRLHPRSRDVLQRASVVGRWFEERILRVLVPAPDLLGEDLDGLAEAELLQHNGGWSFKHAIVQEVAYHSILLARRAELHLQVAEALEAGLGGTAAHSQLAYHFGQAGDHLRAEHHLFLAGAEAARSAASDEALHFFQEASSLYLERSGPEADPEKRLILEKNIAEACFNRGRFIEAAESFSSALAALGEPTPRTRLGQALQSTRTLLGFLMQLYGPGQPQLPAARDREREAIRLTFARAQAQTTASPARFLIDSLDCLRRVRSVDPRSVPQAGGIYAGAVGIFSYGGLSFRIADRLLRDAKDMVDPADAREVFQFQLWRFLHRLLCGDWNRLERIPEELIEENLRLGRLWEVTTYLGLLAELQVYQGTHREARTSLERLAKLERAYGYALASSNRQGISGFLELERRDFDAARRELEQYYADHRETLMNLLALSTLAKLELLRDDVESAAAFLAKASDLTTKAGVIPPFHASHFLQAQLQMTVIRLERARGAGARSDARRAQRDARSRVRRAAAGARRIAWRRPEIYRLCGTAHWLRGRRTAAYRWWERSVEEAQIARMAPEVGRTLLEVARRSREVARGAPEVFHDAPITTCADRARAIFEEYDLAWDLQQLEAVDRS